MDAWDAITSRRHMRVCRAAGSRNPMSPRTLRRWPWTDRAAAPSGTYPIHHHVAEPDRFEHPDKAGHPRATPIGNRPRNIPMR